MVFLKHQTHNVTKGCISYKQKPLLYQLFWIEPNTFHHSYDMIVNSNSFEIDFFQLIKCSKISVFLSWLLHLAKELLRCELVQTPYQLTYSIAEDGGCTGETGEL